MINNTVSCPCCGATIAANLVKNRERMTAVSENTKLTKDERYKEMKKFDTLELIACPAGRFKVGAGA